MSSGVAKKIYRFKPGDCIRVKRQFGGNGQCLGVVEKATYNRKIHTGGNIGYLTVKWATGYTETHAEERKFELATCVGCGAERPLDFECRQCTAAVAEYIANDKR